MSPGIKIRDPSGHIHEEAQTKQIQLSINVPMMTTTSDPDPIGSHNVTVPWDGAHLLGAIRGGGEGSTTLSPAHNNQTQKSIRELLYNGTGYYIEDEGETGLNDIQTVFLACIATLIPLTAILITAFGIRLLWERYRKRKENTQYDGILHREGTSESIARPLHSHLLTDKSSGDTHLTINTDEVEVCDGIEINSQIRSNNHSSTNGSIITMTLKNNHLIVETEERNDIEEDSRETTMKYCPGARDGVFVVEVQQGIRRSPSSGGQNSCAEQELSISVSDQCALVHNPPDRYSDEETLEECDDSEYYIETASPNTETPDSLAAQIKTGLAQSNASLTQPSYCYTRQQCYDNGSYGYPMYCGYVNDEPLQRLPDDTRPKIMSAVYKKSNPERAGPPLALMNGLKDATDDEAKSSDDEVQREQIKLGNLRKYPAETSPNVGVAQNDISPVDRKEAGSADRENKGFDCDDGTES